MTACSVFWSSLDLIYRRESGSWSGVWWPIGYKEIKVFELETDPTKLCLVQTFFIGQKHSCCEELLDSVITGEPSHHHQDQERAFSCVEGMADMCIV